MALGWQLVTDVDAENPILGDIQRSGARLVRLEDRRASIAQACTVLLNWWLGQWWLRPDKGMPYIQELLGKVGVSSQTALALLERELKTVSGVTGIASADVAFDRVTGNLSITNLVVRTVVGNVAVGDVGGAV